MASSIISTTIDETFPVAGQDNDSQGFRDNFTIIKDNFAFAKSEIETLQDTTAKLNADNNFNNNTQSQLNLKQYTVQKVSVIGTTGIVPYTFNNGQFVSVNVQGSFTLNITNWPTTSNYSEIIFSISPNTSSSAYTVTFTSENSDLSGASTILTDAFDTQYVLTGIEKAGNFTIGQTYTILTTGSPSATDFTLIGASNNNTGTLFTATGVGTGNGLAYYTRLPFDGATITVPNTTTERKLVKVFTYDNGANVFLQYLGNYKVVP